MAPFMKIAGEHSGRPPPYPLTRILRDGIFGSDPTALCPAAATPANGGEGVPAHDRIELRRVQWIAAALAALCGLVAYSLWASTNHEETLGEVVTASESAVYTLVVSPVFDASDLAAIQPREVTMQPPDSRSKAREDLANQLAREMDAITTRHALLTRHRAAISRPLFGHNPEPWSTLGLQGELERMTVRGVQDLPTAVVDTTIDH